MEVNDYILFISEDFSLNAAKIDGIFEDELDVTNLLTGVIYSTIHKNQVLSILDKDYFDKSVELLKAKGIKFSFDYVSLRE